jgi:hypothetical protein
MDKDKSSETGYSSNMLDFPVNKEERVIVHILATKFHTEPATNSWLESKLNATIKYLVINRPDAKNKSSKRHKKEESTAEEDGSVGENQPVLLDSSLKAEIVKLM